MVPLSDGEVAAKEVTHSPVVKLNTLLPAPLGPRPSWLHMRVERLLYVSL